MDNEVTIHVKADDDTNVTSLGQKLKAKFSRIGGDSGNKLQGSFRQALVRNLANAAAMVPLMGGPIIAAAPIIGAAAAGGMVLAFGAGIAGLGLAFAAQNEKVKQGFSDTMSHVTKTMQQISKPFEGVLLHVNSVFRSVFDAFVPYLADAFKKMEAPLKTFVSFLGQGLKALAPTIAPITAAFNSLLAALGPAIPEIMRNIAKGITAVADSVAKNPEGFVALIKFFSQVIEWGLKLIAWLNGAVKAFATFAVAVVTSMRIVNNAVMAFFGAIVNGAAKAFGWMPGIGPKVKAAADSFNTFRAAVERQLASAEAATRRFRASLNGIPNTKTITVGVRDAASARIQGIRRHIESLHDKTVSVNVYYHQRVIGVAPSSGGARPSSAGFAHGGVIGAASGGARSNLTMVGEMGRELVRLPAGSSVIPNGRTERMMGGGGGTQRVEIEWVGGNGGDEFLNWLKKNIRTRSGGGTDSVQRALGSA